MELMPIEYPEANHARMFDPRMDWGWHGSDAENFMQFGDARIPVLVVGISAKNGPAWLDGYGFSVTRAAMREIC